MNDDVFERLFADGLTGLAPTRAPAGLGSTIKTSTSRKRPRPRWLALMKEPPMRLSSRVAVGSPTVRVAVVMAATMSLILMLAAAAIAASTLLSDDSAVDTGDWPMFKRDAARTGGTIDGPVGGPVLDWQYAADGSVTSNISIVRDLVFIASDEGVLRAVGREDGLERWRYTTDAPPIAGPSVIDGVVYAADGSEIIVAIDAMTGAERWRSTASGVGSPIPARDGLLLAGTTTGDLVAIDAVSGAEAWRVQVSPTGGPVRAPAYADGRAYVASEGGGFVAVDVATREIAWRFDTGAAQTGTAGVIDGIAYIGGSGDGGDGLLWALNAATGEQLWQIDEPIFTPAVADGVGYSGSVSGLITAFDTATGAILWQKSVDGTARPLAVADGIVYIPADGEQRVYALDARTGDELWRFDLDGGIDCCIAVAHGSVFVGTQLGSVYAIGGSGGEPPGPPASEEPDEPAAAVPSTVPAASTVASPVSALSSAKPFELEDGTEPGGSAAVLEWSTDGGADPMRNPSGLAIAPDGRIWVIDSGNSRIGIFEPDGTLVEYWGTEGDGPGEFVLHRANGDGSSNVAFAPDGSFFLLDAGGMQVQHWSADRQFIREWGGFGSEPGRFIAPGWLTTDEAGNVYVVDAERNVVEIFDPEGNVLRTFEADDRSGTAWTISVDPRGDIWVGTCCPDATLRVFDATGRLLRTLDQEVAAPLVFGPAGRIFSGQFPTPGAKDLIVVFDGEGTELARFGGVPATPGGMGFPWGMALDGDGNLYANNYGAEDGTSGSLMKYRLQVDLLTEGPPSKTAQTTSVDGSAFGQPFHIEIPSDGSTEVVASNRNVAAFHALSSGLTLWVVETHRSDPCRPSEGEAVRVTGPNALVEFLKSVPELDVIELEPGDLGGHPARVIEIMAVEGPEGCDREVIPWAAGGEQLTFPPGVAARLLIAGIGGQTVVAEIWAEDLASWLPLAEAMVETLRFDSGGSMVGTWRRDLICQDLVAAFDALGLTDLAPEFIVGIGMQAGPPERLASLRDPCDGASVVGRRLEVHDNGIWAGIDEATGQRVDGSEYELLGPDTLRIRVDTGDPETVLGFDSDGTTLSFEVVSPGSCEDDACRSQLAWATAILALGPWESVRD